MTDYVKSTNFASKDSLAIGNPLKIVKGTEIDTEFNNIATAVATKADLNSPTLTGTPTAPTAAVNTNTTQVATTAYVVAQIADDAPTKIGGGASGTWNINISGNASSASTVNSISTSQVLNAIAGASAGAVGTYAFATRSIGTTDTAFGSTAAGSELSPASSFENVNITTAGNASLFLSVGSLLSGTWRCMGEYDYYTSNYLGNSGYGATLWLRIA